tara:strand:+ start:12243 stop:12473 length:231 start_codon:yes stop_codon:yes gene_type:complete
MIDNINEYEQTNAWLKANQASKDNSIFIDDRHAIIVSSDPYGLFAEVNSEVKEYHYCNGELNIVHDYRGNEIWRIK